MMPSELTPNRTILRICPECGDLGCGAITVCVAGGAGVVEWKDFGIHNNDEVYEGMIVGENSRDNDMVVNPIREKKLTNIRTTSADEAIVLRPPRIMSLEQALEYIEDDEYVEVTPKAIRMQENPAD